MSAFFSPRPWFSFALAIVTSVFACSSSASAAGLRAGVAKVDVTNRDAGPVNDPLYVKALVLTDGSTTAILITVDAVAIGGIGPIRDEYLGIVRSAIRKEFGVKPENVLINASHCHGIVRSDVDQGTIQAVREAFRGLVPVRAGAGVGHEERIMENRRLKLKDGAEADVRHAYSLPPEGQVAEIGPVDPEIGLLRLDREDGRTLAAVYNFACHPIQGVPNGGNTADLVGFASRTIEENLSEGTVAFFLQGCGGDINPILYKDVNNPRDAEPLGVMLGLSALRGLKKIQCRAEPALATLSATIPLPRVDSAERIRALETEQARLLRSLKGTSLNLKTFLPLAVKYQLSSEFPSYESHRYLREAARGRSDLKKLDADNRENMRQYVENIHVMEQLTRVQTNLDLLRKHQAANKTSAKTIDVELAGLRVGDFRLVTFPGELTVRIGLNIKKASPHDLTFVAGYTNGYIFYAPTTEQGRNSGCAQEDCDCLLAPGWQPLFERKAAEIVKGL